MNIGLPSILWTFIYVIVGLWVTMRILAIILQYVIRRKTGILVKIDRVGFGAFHKIHIGIRHGLQVEIDKIWLSSCYVNDGIRQPVVLCMGEVRIQANSDGPRDQDTPAQPHQQQATAKQVALPKFATYLQHFGLKIQSLTIMLLKTMVEDCLIHVEGQSLGLDISCVEDSLQFIINAGSLNCRALRSVTGDDSQVKSPEPCLAEMSFSLYIDLSLYRDNVKLVKGSRVLINKPQVMLTEGLLSGAYYLKQTRQNAVPQAHIDTQTETETGPKFLKMLPQELGIDVSNVDVKIVRETKQRSLSVGIRTLHVDMFNNMQEGSGQEVACTVLVEDFSTKSHQAKFAELLKLEVKSMLQPEEVTLRSTVQGAYFHYHHDEVQYWVMVIAQLSQKRDNQRVNTELQPIENTETQTGGLSAIVCSRKVTLDVQLLDISTAFSTAACPGLVLGVSRVVKHLTLKPALQATEGGVVSWLKSHDLSYELEVDTLYCTHTDAQIPVAELIGSKHFWNHVLYATILIVKINKLGHELRVSGMQDHLHLEWSTNTINIIISLLTALSRTKLAKTRKLSNAAFMPVTGMNIPVAGSPDSETMLHVKFDVSNTNVFVCNNYNVCLMLRVDAAGVEYRQQQAVVTVEGTKLQYLHMTDKYLNLVRSCDVDHPAVNLKEIRITYKVPQKAATVQLAKVFMLDWTTACHMCIIQALEDVAELRLKLRGEEVGQANIPVEKPMVEQNVKLSVSVMVTTQISLTLRLSSKHSVTLCADNVLVSFTPQELLTEISNVDIFCDKEKIFKFEGLLFGTLPEGELKHERKDFKTLTKKTNRAWNISIDALFLLFPYNFDFAACFEEFVNFQKWMKLVHRVKKKPFTVDSKLPPDLQIMVKSFCLEICDDPFEVKLGDNFELMKDECTESEKRRHLLDQRVNNLKKGYGIIPAEKLEEVYSSLAKSNSDIYIQRSRQLYQITPLRTKLFTWVMDKVEVVALADVSIHGKDNVVKHMQEIDPDSPFPEEGLEFTTLWCRYVNFSVKTWTFQFRDYPQLAMDIKDMTIWGRLVGAEIEGPKRAKRSSTVEVEQPWGNTTVERNLPALKFFHDFSCDVESFELAYGACWEPVTAQFNLALDLINKPSIDPSQPLPWWDKIRLLLHGRLTMTVAKMSWLYHASLDPYNSTELMDWTWSDLVMDWTNTKFELNGNLDIYARTASKYDDCRLLHLPSLRFCAKLDWLCLGDPNDHHQVMPCAPDKVPDYSLEEHDSFRAFRSQNMNLHISLETSSSMKETLKKDHPEALFYASSLRFLEKIKMCLANVTRPIKRGTLFENTRKKKPQLSRHYKYATLSVNFHQFDVKYWMSFSMQHGAKFSGSAFKMELKNELSLCPVDDGLIHRPDANWSVIYLLCDLSGTKIWLCSTQVRHQDELDVSTTGKPVTTSFILSVSRVSYQRSSMKNEMEIEGKLPEPSKTPTHNLQVYEMRGSWTKENRTVLLGLYDGYMKAQSLKRNLSAEALKGFKVEGGSTPNSKANSKSTQLAAELSSAATPSPSTKMQTGHAHSMLLKLVAESDSKTVAFTEEPSSANMDQLHGVAACQTDDVTQKNWLIELHNSQIVVKGCETQGFVIVGAARAQILSCTHVPVWVESQLRSKDTWMGSIECMQYYATVDPSHEFGDENIPWLSKTHVEDRSEPDPSGLQEMAGSGHSVGGIVNTSYGGSHKSKTVQLQRIISRCKCQFFYANYGEVDRTSLTEVPPPPSEDSDMMKRKEGVDTFTLLHHDLNVCTNHLQYMMILDIVNNLLLHVESKKKEVTEKLQSMRFQLQLSRVEDQKTPILNLQENVRQQMEKYRHHEKELFLVMKALEEEEEDDGENDIYSNELLQDQETLENMLRKCKEKINSLNEELAIRISCFKESQLQVQAQLQAKQTQQAHVIRRNEVCFKFAQWRLTETDGQVGITDLTLRNFVYTKVNRDNDTWSHQVELGWVKMTNLLRNSIYKDVLVPKDPLGQEDNRKMALRVLCTERPPVGGIAVKEHFEVNVVPLQIQLTYEFSKKMMEFFFPDKNIDNEDGDDDLEGGAAAKPSKEKKGQKKEMKRSPSFSATDDIDKMKERAANNNTFLYIKIPEVVLKVSYKGVKDKNILDVHDFGLVLPTLEYHNCIWTWYDLLMAMKSDSKRALISQAIKQKLHMRSRIVGEETPLTDVQQEEDKAKMLLGAKLLAPQEKPAKKSLFGKSQK